MLLILREMDKEPTIVSLENPILFVGLATKTDVRSIYLDTANLGKEFSDYKKYHEISNLKKPCDFVAYRKDFDHKTIS